MDNKGNKLQYTAPQRKMELLKKKHNYPFKIVNLLIMKSSIELKKQFYISLHVSFFGGLNEIKVSSKSFRT